MTAARDGAAEALGVCDLVVDIPVRGGTVRAVGGISFTVAQGEVLTVIGESGSGKSVLLRTLLHLLPPHARRTGTVRLAGRDLAAMTPAELQRARGKLASLVFQEPMTALDPLYTIGAQIAEVIVRHDGVSWQTAWQRGRDLLERVAIPSAARRMQSYPHEMSGGMRQRAMIALALSCRPGVLLADEPTTALDATVQMQLLVLLRDLQRELGMAMVFVTHDMAVAAEISDRVAVMYAGRLVEIGTAEDVLLDPRHPYTVGLLRSTIQPGMKGTPLQAIGGAPPDLRHLPPGCSFAPRCTHATGACTTAFPADTAVGARHHVRCVLAGQAVPRGSVL